MTDLVIDANVALALVVPLPYSGQANAQLEQWQAQDAQLAAPTLWGYEVTSSLRRGMKAGLLTEAQALEALEEFWALQVEEVPATLQSHQRAMRWAERLEATVAYDAQYLALAERLGVPLWTADRKLQRRTRALGIDWIHWIGESE